MGTTTRYGFPYPERSGLPDLHLNMKDALEAVETDLATVDDREAANYVTTVTALFGLDGRIDPLEAAAPTTNTRLTDLEGYVNTQAELVLPGQGFSTTTSFISATSPADLSSTITTTLTVPSGTLCMVIAHLNVALATAAAPAGEVVKFDLAISGGITSAANSAAYDPASFEPSGTLLGGPATLQKYGVSNGSAITAKVQGWCSAGGFFYVRGGKVAIIPVRFRDNPWP